ncbi:hypothetical protein TREES_T100009797 [Tupaia chinensis]|uniref:Uncharacterized protein n=1 Tax=Tupaia chinensis TaxID=246437 RepID=L9KVI5_TUPCH|nr:hypothetical protein TREES_T100009797 [Tupaia chinensis]
MHEAYNSSKAAPQLHLRELCAHASRLPGPAPLALCSSACRLCGLLPPRILAFAKGLLVHIALAVLIGLRVHSALGSGNLFANFGCCTHLNFSPTSTSCTPRQKSNSETMAGIRWKLLPPPTTCRLWPGARLQGAASPCSGAQDSVVDILNFL